MELRSTASVLCINFGRPKYTVNDLDFSPSLTGSI